MDAYISEFTAQVISCQEIIKDNKTFYEIILNDTFFYPEGGGQQGDVGWIDDVNIIDTYYKYSKIIHLAISPIELNSEVKCKINWDIRYRRMQSHSGEHIISGIIKEYFNYNNIGFHMNDNFITIDYDGIIQKNEILDIEFKCNKVIQENIPIEEFIYASPSECNLNYRSKKEINQNLRVIKIGMIDSCACCGTHVRTTSEINLIHIVDSKIIQNTTRLVVVIGNRAIEYIYNLNYTLNKVSELLSSPIEKVETAVKNILLSKQEIEYQLIQSKFSQVSSIIKNTNLDVDLLIIDLTTFTMKEINFAIKQLSSENKIIFIYTKYNFLLKINQSNFKNIFQDLREKNYIQAGGSSNFIQGKLLVKPEILISYLEEQID